MEYRKLIVKANLLVGHFWAKCLSIVLSLKYHQIYRKINVNKYQCSRSEIKSYKRKWKGLGYVDPIYYKLFSCYVTPDVCFLPEDISHNVVESLLNPPIYRGLYNDKNMFDKFLSGVPSSLPYTFLRRIRGHYYDINYKRISISNEEFLQIIKDEWSIVIKKTVATSSGNGVFFFSKYDGNWINDVTKEPLSLLSVNTLIGRDYIVQKRLEQSDFMAQFNKSSVNTIRVLVYRSVKDDTPHVVNAIMRIGKNGAIVDNAHQGGATIGINNKGMLNSFLVDQYAQRFTVFNGIDFSKNTYTIPNWSNIVSFSENSKYTY